MKKGWAGFVSRTFPVKGDGRKQVFFKLLFLAAFVVFIVSACVLLSYGFRYLNSKKTSNDLAKLYHPQTSSVAPSSPSGNGFADLLSINKDLKGWITVPHTGIDYPVVQTSDNAFYLTHNFYKKSDYYGNPFLDKDCPTNPLGQNTIVYGHNMKDSLMFHDLVNYRNVDFYKTSPVITFNTLHGNYRWKVFAVFIANTEAKDGPAFPYLIRSFGSDADFTNYITQVKRRSILNIDVDVGPGDRILTLSTCTYEFKDARLVVEARLLRSGETAQAADVSKNPSPLMPDVWYRLFGGSKPAFPDPAS